MKPHAFTAVVAISLVALGGIATADPPNPADVETCNKEAAAAESTSPSASPRAITDTQSNADDETTSAITRSDGSKRDAATPNVTSSAAARQAFAGCLARHGYYKGYYHH